MSPGTALDLLYRCLSWKLAPLALAALWLGVPGFGLWLIVLAAALLTPLVGYVLVTMRRWGWLAGFVVMVLGPLWWGPPAHVGLVSLYLWLLLPFASTLLYGIALQQAVIMWYGARQYALRWAGEGAEARAMAPESPRTGR